MSDLDLQARAIQGLAAEQDCLTLGLELMISEIR